MTSENYIIEDKVLTEELMQFKVKKLNPLSWILILILAIIPVSLVYPIFSFLALWIIVSFFLALFIAPLLWKKAGVSLLNGIFIENFKKWKEGGSMGIFRTIINSLLGISMSSDYYYYLEASVVDINLNKIKSVISNRIFNVTSAAIGISFLIATILRMVVNDVKAMNMILGISLTISVLSPLILFWLIPILWTVQDANIKYSDENQDIGDLSQKVSKSLIRKVLGITGIALAFSFFLDTNVMGMTQATNIFQRYMFAAMFVLLIIFLNIGESLLSGIIYLNFYHEKVVQKFRSELAKVLEVGVTSVRNLSENERALIN